jgi:two-component system, chemotaxis family, chemotaxis protein CheY
MSKIRALVVDDDAIIRFVVARCLDDNPDIELAICESANQALARLNSGEKYDWLILDWNMPEMSGYQLLCILRANHRFSDVRVLILTARTDLDDVKQALSAGANEYLMKPFTKEMLLEKLAMLALN